nr:TauD/TfdA family dioxygenase [Kibdelosporangium sp. MJ126-NF4]CEL17614.1 hypothetical protein [Kibdelosporangium sp. MJ126-NF4]CTQ91158.1 hypothetical protein [Kibdelosporangium sp. MJ126-NF4]
MKDLTTNQHLSARDEDLAVIAVPAVMAQRLAARCTAAMTGHQWSMGNLRTARAVLRSPDSASLVGRLAARLSRRRSAPGWAVLALPPSLDDGAMRIAAAGLLGAVGRPFFSISQQGRLWIGQESSPARDVAAFGGIGEQRLHIDAPNVERVPDYTSLLILRPDPAGGGASLIGDLHAAMSVLSDDDRAQLARPVFFEGRADGLSGVGAPRMPFPILDATGGGPPWIRWAGKMLDDPRNDSDLMPVVRRFADALTRCTHELMLHRGHLLIADQQRVAHGRTALGDQTGLPDGSRRLLQQAKAAAEPTAPVHDSMLAGHGE